MIVNRTKKNCIIIICTFICVFLGACKGESKTPDFADEMIVKLSYTPVNVENDEMTYTMNIEVYQDSTICIYADGFSKWYGEDEPERMIYNISENELQDIKDAIVEEDLYNLHSDVGNKDNMEGVRKSITIYTVQGEHEVYGINPSNRSFIKVYDLITGLRREELASYVGNVNDIQERGLRNDVGVYLKNQRDEIVFQKEDIKDIYFDDEKDLIVVELVDSAKETLMEMTQNMGKKEYISFTLYNDNEFEFALAAYENTEDGKLYANNTYDESERETVIKELKEGLE